MEAADVFQLDGANVTTALRELSLPHLVPVFRDIVVAIRDAVRSFVAYAIVERHLEPTHWLAVAARTPDALVPILSIGHPRAGLAIKYRRARIEQSADAVNVHVLVLVCRRAAASSPPPVLPRESDELEILQRYGGYWMRTVANVLVDVLITVMSTVFDKKTTPAMDTHAWSLAERRLYVPALTRHQQHAKWLAHVFDHWTQGGAMATRLNQWWAANKVEWGAGRSGHDLVHSVDRYTAQRPGLSALFARWLVTDLAWTGEEWIGAILPAGAAVDLQRATDWVYVTHGSDLGFVWLPTGTRSINTLDGDTEEEMLESFYRRAEFVANSADNGLY